MDTKFKKRSDLESLNRVICVMGYTCSASCLLSSSLDNHPNVLSFPDNVLSDFEDFWQKNCSLNLDDLISQFLDHYTTIFDATTTRKDLEGTAETGESRGFTTLGKDRKEYLKVDKSVFRNHIKNLITEKNNVQRKTFFQAIHIAYGKALDRDVINPIIVFGLHSLRFPQRLKALMEDFSDVSFLMMVRHPVRALASRVDMQLKREVSVSHFHRILIGICGGGVYHSITSKDKWRAIRMEELHQSPEQNLKKICNWIKIPWSETLLDSTINGKMWWNDKGADLQISGFNMAFATENFDKYLYSFDRFRLNALFIDKFSSWDYKVTFWDKAFITKILYFVIIIFPIKMELMLFSSMIKVLSKVKNRP